MTTLATLTPGGSRLGSAAPPSAILTGGGPAWLQHERGLVHRCRVLAGRVAALRGQDDPVIVAALSTADLLTALQALCGAVDALAGGAADPPGPLRTELTDLLNRHLDYEYERLTWRLADGEQALTRLRTCSGVDALLDRVCVEAATGLGFTRVVLSRVDGRLWRPWMAHFVDPPVEGEWFREWVDRPIALDDLVVEARILRDRRPALIRDTDSADVYRPIIVEAGRSACYVVAPVVIGGQVIGFLHADFSPSGRGVDEVDRDALWFFADGFAQLYERAVLRDRLRAQRDEVVRALAATDCLLAESADPVRLVSVAAPEQRPDRPAAGTVQGLDVGLTERERQVLALVAAGASNGRIAGQLVVTEGTVKTHMKHILRKLGVANRTQAIARFHGC